MKPSPAHRPFRPAFTLVELLVTIVIIVALAGITFSVFRSIRQSAALTVSMNRLKSLAQANALYAADHNGRYVPILSFDENNNWGVAWHSNPDFLRSIAGDLSTLENVTDPDGVGGMPESLLDPVVVKARSHYWDRIPASYGYNQENIPNFKWFSKNETAQQSIQTITDPSRTFNFITATDWLVRYSSRLNWVGKPVEGKTGDGKIAFRHGGKAIAAFYDGHTEMVTPDDIRKFDVRGGVSNLFWSGTRQ